MSLNTKFRRKKNAYIRGGTLAMFEFLFVAPVIGKKTHGRVSGLWTQLFAHILASRLKYGNRQGDATSIIIFLGALSHTNELYGWLRKIQVSPHILILSRL